MLGTWPAVITFDWGQISHADSHTRTQSSSSLDIISQAHCCIHACNMSWHVSRFSDTIRCHLSCCMASRLCIRHGGSALLVSCATDASFLGRYAQGAMNMHARLHALTSGLQTQEPCLQAASPHLLPVRSDCLSHTKHMSHTLAVTH